MSKTNGYVVAYFRFSSVSAGLNGGVLFRESVFVHSIFFMGVVICVCSIQWGHTLKVAVIGSYAICY